MRVRRHPTNLRRMLASRLKRIAAHKPLLGGASLVTRGHNRGHQLTYSVQGKTHTVYVPVDFTEEVRSWIEEYRRLKRLLQEISQLSLALVRSHVQERKRKRSRS